jgi:hypothetical protein
MKERRTDERLTSLLEAMTKAGLVGGKMRRTLRLSSVRHLLENPFYCGAFYHKGVLHQGSHAPMISKKTWDDIQRARAAVAKPRQRRGEKGLSFLNFATCGHCGHCITGERHRKKSGRVFRYYRCTHRNGERGCSESAFVRHEQFADEMRRNVRLVTLPDEWKERFIAKLEVWEANDTASRQDQIARLRAELTTVRGRIERLNEAFIDGSIDLAEFKELKNPLVPRKVELEAKMVALEKTKLNRVEPVRNWIFEANSLGKTVAEGNEGEMKAFLLKVGLNRVSRDQTLTVSFVKPWSALAETNLAVLADNELAHASEKWWR